MQWPRLGGELVLNKSFFGSDKCKVLFVQMQGMIVVPTTGVGLQNMVLFKRFKDHSRARISGYSSGFVHQKPPMLNLICDSS